MRERLDRHKVLVLDGPSRYGKTTFCKQLVQVDAEYLELNCQGLEAPPNLRLITSETKLINFDEASLRWCLQHKKMLQGPEASLTMADSATGCHAYQVDLWGIMMIVCSNAWSEELQDTSLTEWERDYLGKNFIHVRVTGPLWEDASQQ